MKTRPTTTCRAVRRLSAAVGIATTLLFCPGLGASSIDVLPAAAHTGAHGARVTVESGGAALVQDNSPSAESDYFVRYYTKTSGLAIPTTESLDQFVAYNDPGDDGGGIEQFRVSLTQTGCQASQDVTVDGEIVTTDRTACETIIATNSTVTGDVTFSAGLSIALGDGFVAGGGGNSFTALVDPVVKNGETQVSVVAPGVTPPTPITLPSGWNAIEVGWSASTGSNDGTIELWVNGSSVWSDTHNDMGQIDNVQWGATAVGSNTTGTMDLDDFDSRRVGPIGQ